jgi:hypothetical protein
MTLQHSGLAVLAAAILIAPGLASAQAVSDNFIEVSSTPSTASYAPGTTDAVLGTITLTATQPGSYQVSSLPLTLSTSGSGSSADLTGCQLINSSGSALNTNANVLNPAAAGTNTFMFDTPLTVTSGSPVVLSLRCNTSSATPTGTMFYFNASAPVLVPSLAVTLTTFPSVTPGEVDAPIAAITLDPSASSANLNITSLPLSVTYGNGLVSSELSNCHTVYAGSTLDSGSAGVINDGANTITFNGPLSATAGGSAMPLLLSCNVAPSAPIGSTLALSIAPSGIMASNAADGTVVSATQGYDPTTGTLGALGGTTTVVSPTVITTTTTTTGVTPPNTGAGAAAPMNIAFLIGSALLALLGMAYLARTLRTE